MEIRQINARNSLKGISSRDRRLRMLLTIRMTNSPKKKTSSTIKDEDLLTTVSSKPQTAATTVTIPALICLGENHFSH